MVRWLHRGNCCVTGHDSGAILVLVVVHIVHQRCQFHDRLVKPPFPMLHPLRLHDPQTHRPYPQHMIEIMACVEGRLRHVLLHPLPCLRHQGPCSHPPQRLRLLLRLRHLAQLFSMLVPLYPQANIIPVPRLPVHLPPHFPTEPPHGRLIHLQLTFAPQKIAHVLDIRIGKLLQEPGQQVHLLFLDLGRPAVADGDFDWGESDGAGVAVGFTHEADFAFGDVVGVGYDGHSFARVEVGFDGGTCGLCKRGWGSRHGD